MITTILDFIRFYRLVGKRMRQTAAVFWRDNVLHGADWLQAKMADHPADRYYTNDPARLSFPGVERFAAIETVFVEGMA